MSAEEKKDYKYEKYEAAKTKGQEAYPAVSGLPGAHLPHIDGRPGLLREMVTAKPPS